MSYGWRLADLPPPTGPKVFSCFHCGGGSSMGYKLAGCDVIGGVDIDAKMVRVYRRNLKPRFSHIGDIRGAPLPPEHVDILDGSPPCTSFTISGVRERDWGVAKAKSEGAAVQRLDDLFFHFIAYAERFKPRVVVAENVVGMLLGNARGYVVEIKRAFEAAGYSVQLFKLSAADFGVPQVRPRVFFVAQLQPAKPLVIKPTGPRVTVAQAFEGIDPLDGGRPLRPGKTTRAWQETPRGRDFNFKANARFGTAKLNPNGVAPTITSAAVMTHWDKPIGVSDRAIARLQSFPDDYDFTGANATYVCGMSVPPLLMRGIASQIVEQVFAPVDKPKNQVA